MSEYTLEQQRAIAKARARARARANADGANLLERAGDRVAERFDPAGELGESLQNEMSVRSMLPGFPVDAQIPDMTSNVTQLAGKNVAGAAWDVLGEAVQSAWDTYNELPFAEANNQKVKEIALPAIQSYADSWLGQKVGDIVFQGIDAWSKFSKDNPKQARNAEAVANIALFINPAPKRLPLSNGSNSVLNWLDDINPIKPRSLEKGGPVRGPIQQGLAAASEPTKIPAKVGAAMRRSGLKQKAARKEAFVQKLVEPVNPLADKTRVARTQQQPGPLGRLVTQPSAQEAAAIKETMLTNVSPRVSLTENAKRINDKIKTLSQNLEKGLKEEAKFGRIERAKSKSTINVGGIRVVDEPAGIPRGHYYKPEVEQLLRLSLGQAKATPFAVGSEKAIERVYETFLKHLGKNQVGTLDDLWKARINFDKTYRGTLAKLQKEQQGALTNQAAMNDAVSQIRQDINSFLIDRAGSASVKDTLRRTSALYTARDAVRAKAVHEASNRIYRFLQTATRNLALRDTSLQWYSLGTIAAGAVASPWFPAVGATLAIPGALYIGGRIVGGPGARKAVGKLLMEMDKAIRMTTDPELLRQLRVDRAAILEMAKEMEEYQ